MGCFCGFSKIVNGRDRCTNPRCNADLGPASPPEPKRAKRKRRGKS